jgi:hypothetical protein
VSDLKQALAVVIEEARLREHDLPIARRVLLYRGLAEICGDAAETRELIQLAHDLESAERRCREFRFNINPKP